MVRAMPVGGDVDAARTTSSRSTRWGRSTSCPTARSSTSRAAQFRRDYSFEDLFRWDARHARRRCGSRTGQRARDPAVSPDGRRIAFSMNEHSESVLAVMDAVPDAPASVVWRGERYDQAYQPAWSPDGTRIAFSAWRNGGYRDILVVELASGKVDEITHDRAIDMSPAWSPDGRYIYFDSDRTEASRTSTRTTPRERATWQVTNVLGGAFQPRPSPDGKRLAFEAAVPEGGYDLFEVAARSRALAARRATTSTTSRRRSTSTTTRPTVTRAAAVPRARDARAADVDAAARHRRSHTREHPDRRYRRGRAAQLLARDRPRRPSTGDTNIGASYGYIGLAARRCGSPARARCVERGGWRVDGVNKTLPRGGLERARSSVGVPFESRPGSSWSLSFDYDVDWFRLVAAAGDRRSIRTSACRRIRRPTTSRRASARASRSRRCARTTFGARCAERLRRAASRCASIIPRSARPTATSPSATRPTATSGCGARRRCSRCGSSARCAPATSCAPAASALGGVPAQDVAMSIVNSTRVGVDRLPARLSGAHDRRQPVPPAQPRVPPGAVPDRARPRDAADLPAPRAPGAARATSARRSTTRSTPSSNLRRVGRRRAPRRRVLRLLRPGHVRDRLRARPHRGRRQRDLVPADGEPVKDQRSSAGERRGRGRAAARRAGARAARSARARRRSPRASRRDLDRADAVSVALAADAAPGPRGRVPRGDAARAPARRARSRARTTSAPDWFDLAAAVDLGLRLAGHHLGPGIELLFDLGNAPPARGVPGTLALARRSARRGVRAVGARGRRQLAVACASSADDGWGVVLDRRQRRRQRRARRSSASSRATIVDAVGRRRSTRRRRTGRAARSSCAS